MHYLTFATYIIFYHPWFRHANSFGRISLSVCNALASQILGCTKFILLCRYVFRIFRLSSYVKAVGRVRPILVSGIGQYSPVRVGIGISRYLFEHRHRYQ